MRDIRKLFYETSFMLDKMGGELDALGGVLRCKVCGHEMPIAPGKGQTAQYLASGWPRHCEQGMTWVTQKELDEDE